MGLISAILFNASLLTSTIFLTNYIILKNLSTKINIPDIAIVTVIISIISYIIGYCVSIYSSKSNCKNTNYTIALKQGFMNVFYSIIAYFIVYFVSIIREPFLDIFGNNELGFSIAQSFMIVLNSTISIIINYYNSIKESCKVSQTKLEKNLKKLDKYLDKKPKKKNIKKIEIKD